MTNTTIPDRPKIKFATSRLDYQMWVTEYVKARYENDEIPAHHKQDYPLVLDCPLCGSLAMIAVTSTTKNPSWQCKLSNAPGHSIRLSDDRLVASSHNTDTMREEKAGWIDND